MKQSAKCDDAVERLRQEILNGTHAPGQALRLTAMSEPFGLRAISLKTMLLGMAKKERVVLGPNSCWRVAPASWVDFEDLLFVRQTLKNALATAVLETDDPNWLTKCIGTIRLCCRDLNLKRWFMRTP